MEGKSEGGKEYETGETAQRLGAEDGSKPEAIFSFSGTATGAFPVRLGLTAL